MDDRFFGIDLGTTTSAIANCELNDLGELNASVDSLERKIMQRNRLIDKRDETLPSCVLYDKDGYGGYDIIVGDHAKDIYSIQDKYTIIGITSVIFYQQIQNIGMTFGLFPITGITLPLISYGGSSLLSYLLLVGIIINILNLDKKKKAYK